MPVRFHKSSAQVEVVLATQEQKPILAQLLELYIHDFSELLDIDVGEDGKFGYPRLASYWNVPDSHPFLVRVAGKFAGFVLIRRESNGASANWDVAEFFVVRAYRRRGIGCEIAHQVWRRFPGAWQVRVLESNVAALQFWSRAISKFLAHPIEPVRVQKEGQRWQYFSFCSEKNVGQRNG